MTDIRSLNRPLILGLGALALVRPLTRIVGSQLGIEHHSAVTISITVLITVVWIAAVGLSRNTAPVLTLVLAGLAYGVLSIALSGVLSPILDGSLRGPLANPVAIIPVLATNAVWGLVAGGLALALQRARGVRPPANPESR
ncbi:hypothetical protein [Saccharomonospora iraqiensis]|uniref:hypothetical protein n=1 Tax=Saccharomonospora iraqiensis TaxID=52698 RepID=UPI00047DBF72|nr:hypothetical protein [Saccharomonospora iraqiensis]